MLLVMMVAFFQVVLCFRHPCIIMINIKIMIQINIMILIKINYDDQHHGEDHDDDQH